MFDETGSRISELSPADRSELEPISEILQIKGASETILCCHRSMSLPISRSRAPSGRPMTFENVKGGYARDALRTGISLSHSGQLLIPLSARAIVIMPARRARVFLHWQVADDGWIGGLANRRQDWLDKTTPARAWGSGGMAGVWATKNTRKALFEVTPRDLRHVRASNRTQDVW